MRHLKVALTFQKEMYDVQHCWDIAGLSRRKTGQILACVDTSFEFSLKPRMGVSATLRVNVRFLPFLSLPQADITNASFVAIHAIWSIPANVNYFLFTIFYLVCKHFRVDNVKVRSIQFVS